MRMTIGRLRRIIRETLLREEDLKQVSIKDVTGMRGTAGSSHEMNKARLVNDEREFFLKFSDIEPGLWSEGDPDPSMQCMSEYLAYRIYKLYPGVRIPARIELVFDPERDRVGLATSAIAGRPALGRVDPKVLAKQLEAGVYVDIFMANYDVVGTGSGNVMMGDAGDVTRLDPGSAFFYRARGKRPKDKFNPRVEELEGPGGSPGTMLDPKFNYGQGSGMIYQFADLTKAAREFLAVPWSAVADVIATVREEVLAELTENGMKKLIGQWESEVDGIERILEERYKVVEKHARKVSAA